jgi:hypothetical protein
MRLFIGKKLWYTIYYLSNPTATGRPWSTSGSNALRLGYTAESDSNKLNALLEDLPKSCIFFPNPLNRPVAHG